jgi:hypothetical protein
MEEKGRRGVGDEGEEEKEKMKEKGNEGKEEEMKEKERKMKKTVTYIPRSTYNCSLDMATNDITFIKNFVIIGQMDPKLKTPF